MIETAQQRHERLLREFTARANNSRNPDVRQTYQLMADAERAMLDKMSDALDD